MPIKKTFKSPDHTHLDFYKSTADYIKSCQSPSGAIPSLKGGKLDPWDHIESIMGLTTLGNLEAARLGFDWLVIIKIKMEVGTVNLLMTRLFKQTNKLIFLAI